MAVPDPTYREVPTVPRPDMGLVLVTGATGYIGGRLVPELLGRGYRVRVMVRERFDAYEELWPGAEIVEGDAQRYESLLRAVEGVHTAYYLIHPMMFLGEKFAALDIQAAINFSRAADHENLTRIIYLGGLGDIDKPFTRRPGHRLEVERELRLGKTPTTVLLASMIIGSGSGFYELMRDVVDRCPVIPLPPWAFRELECIAVRDVVRYLVAVLETPETTGRTLHLGSGEVATLAKLMRFLARDRGKRRLFLPIPFGWVSFYPYLANLITAVPASIIWCQLARIRNGAIRKDRQADELVALTRLGYEEGLVAAGTREAEDSVMTRWSDAYPPSHILAQKLAEMPFPPIYGCEASLLSAKEARPLFRSACKLGGKNGWFKSNWMWRMRGWMDRLVMGVGTIRGRKSAKNLRVNDVIDFFRVEDLVKNRRLLLRVEMRIPGVAWLEFRIDPEEGGNRLTVRAHYQPRGIFGRIYWYVFLPFHDYIFNDLVRQIEARA